MKKIRLFLIVAFGIILAGCGSSTYMASVADVRPNMKKYPANTVLILPPVNETSAADASLYAVAAFSEPFIQNGYYLIPPSLSGAFFASENLSDPAQIAKIAPQKLSEIFGADIIAYTRIWAWDTDYKVLGSRVGVGLELKLVNAKNGYTLWHDSGYYAKQSDADIRADGGPVGLLISAAVSSVSAAINAASDYFPIAQNAANQVILSKPVGKYHPDYATQWSKKSEFKNAFRLKGDKLYTKQKYTPFYDDDKPFFLNAGKKIYIIDDAKKEGRWLYYPVVSVQNLAN